MSTLRIHAYIVWSSTIQCMALDHTLYGPRPYIVRSSNIHHIRPYSVWSPCPRKSHARTTVVEDPGGSRLRAFYPWRIHGSVLVEGYTALFTALFTAETRFSSRRIHGTVHGGNAVRFTADTRHSSRRKRGSVHGGYTALFTAETRFGSRRIHGTVHGGNAVQFTADIRHISDNGERRGPPPSDPLSVSVSVSLFVSVSVCLCLCRCRRIYGISVTTASGADRRLHTRCPSPHPCHPTRCPSPHPRHPTRCPQSSPVSICRSPLSFSLSLSASLNQYIPMEKARCTLIPKSSLRCHPQSSLLWGGSHHQVPPPVGPGTMVSSCAEQRPHRCLDHTMHRRKGRLPALGIGRGGGPRHRPTYPNVKESTRRRAHIEIRARRALSPPAGATGGRRSAPPFSDERRNHAHQSRSPHRRSLMSAGTMPTRAVLRTAVL
jgi:hypothetical protein